MNYKIVLKTIGRLLQTEALLMLLPMAVSFYYKENTSVVFGIVIALLIVTGSLMTLPKLQNRRVYAREGFVIVSLSWMLLSLFGALPFVFSGAIPSFVDALFETVSGFTTTGASILNNIEALPKSILFWRSFTHWIGGMGIIVFVLAILPQKDMQSMHILRAEVPGPTVGKLVSKTTVTARILYIIYGVLTVAEIIALLCCDMPLFDSVTTAFATAGTGGFSVKNASIAAYGNLGAEIVISLFMLLFGINFNLFYLFLMKQFKRVFKSEELWTYLTVIGVAVVLVTMNIYPMVESFGTALRQAGFQVISIITTTGFATADFNLWSATSKSTLVLLMFIGACAGSTGGGLKVSRLIILIKTIFKELTSYTHPKSIVKIKMDDKPIEHEVVRSANVYFITYMIIFVVSVFCLTFENIDLISVFTAVAATFNNIGPGLEMVGPSANFGHFTDFSKLVMIFDMLAGRLELFPLLMLFHPELWKDTLKRKLK